MHVRVVAMFGLTAVYGLMAVYVEGCSAFGVGPAPRDAAADGSDTAPSAPPVPCEDPAGCEEVRCPSSDPRVIICEDFEGDDSLDQRRWNPPIVGGALTLEPTIGRNGSKGLRVRSVEEAQTWMYREVSQALPAGRGLVATLDFSMVTMSTFTFARFRFVESAIYYGAKAYAAPGDCPAALPCVSWGTTSVPWAQAFTPTIGGWHRATIRISSSDAGRSGQLLVDGKLVHDEAALVSDVNPARIQFQLGAIPRAETSEVVLDNIVVANFGD
jgi:hypothetical protein